MKRVVGFLLLLALACPVRAAVTATFSGNTLLIATDAGDSVTVTVVGGNVKVNGADPSSGSQPASNTPYITVHGDSLANVFDVSAVSEANGFPSGVETDLRGEGGDDTLIGSPENDVFHGDAGTDTITCNGGNDYVYWTMGQGADTIAGGPGNDDLRIDGKATADNVRVEGSGANLVFTDVGGGSDMPTASGFEEIYFVMFDGSDQVEVRDVSSTGLYQVGFDGGSGDDTCDASQNTVQTVFELEFGEGSDVYTGSQSDNDLVTIAGRTNDQPTNFVLSQAAGQTVVAIDNPAHQIKFSKIEAISLDGYENDDTFLIPLLTGSDVKRINIWGSSGDDSAEVVASPDYLINVNGSVHNSGDSLTVDAQGQAVTQSQNIISVSGRQNVLHYFVENITIKNGAGHKQGWVLR